MGVAIGHGMNLHYVKQSLTGNLTNRERTTCAVSQFYAKGRVWVVGQLLVQENLPKL